MNANWVSRVLIGVLVIALVALAFLYSRHRELSESHRALQMDVHSRVGALETSVREIRSDVRGVWGRISTTDHEATEPSDFRIPFGSTNTHEFALSLPKWGAFVHNSWISDWRPRDEITKFEELEVYPTSTNSLVRVSARLKPGASVDVSFRCLAYGRWVP